MNRWRETSKFIYESILDQSNKYSGQTELKAALRDFHGLLTPEEYSELLRGSGPSGSSVVELTTKIDRRKPKHKYGSQRIQKFLRSLQQFTTIVDTVIQADPKFSVLVWGSVKMVMLVYTQPQSLIQVHNHNIFDTNPLC